MALTNTWDPTSPADSDNVSAGAGKIRALKTDIAERWGIPSDDYADVATAVAAIGSAERVLLITKAETVAADVTIPSTLTLAFAPEGSITVSNTFTLTINGRIVSHQDKQIFTVNGTLTIGLNQEIRSTWFATIAAAKAALTAGTLVIPDVEDDTTAYAVKSGVTQIDYRTVGSIFINGVATSGLNNATAIYVGRVDSTGTAVKLPSGWTSSKSVATVYTVTHNLGTANYTLVINPTNATGPFVIRLYMKTSTYFEVIVYSLASAIVALGFEFTLVVD